VQDWPRSLRVSLFMFAIVLAGFPFVKHKR
jgi:hypothetical protein